MIWKAYKFDEEKFCWLYLERYGKEWETFVDCANRCIEQWIDEEENFEEWEHMVQKCLPPRIAKRTYKQRAYWPQTVLEKFSWSLWLEVWPKFNKSI